jgi:glycosyltransferase involved in cell wall biosynthesis
MRDGFQVLMQGPTQLLLIEPSAEGHHMALYATHIIHEAQRRGWQTSLLTTSHAQQHPAFASLLDQCQSALQLYEIPCVIQPRETRGAFSLLMAQHRFFKALKRSCVIHRDALSRHMVYMVNLDHCDKAMALWGSPFGIAPFCGMQMRVKFHHCQAGLRSSVPWKEHVFAVLFRRLARLKQLRLITVLDETLLEYYQNTDPAVSAKLRLIPEIGFLSTQTNRVEARRTLGMTEDKRLLLVYGSIDERKGIERLLQAMANTRFPRNISVIIAGRFKDTGLKLLENPTLQELRQAGRLDIMNRFIPASEEEILFRAADAVWLGYEGHHGSSGVLFQAAAAGVPLIACTTGLIGRWTRQYQIGETIDAGDPKRVMAALQQLFQDEGRWHQFSTHSLALAKQHTPQKFGEAICDVIWEGHKDVSFAV